MLYTNQLLIKMQIEGTVFPNAVNNMEVATLSHQKDSKHILRINPLLFNYEKDGYEVFQELAVFNFEDRNELTYFLDNLPHLNDL